MKGQLTTGAANNSLTIRPAPANSISVRDGAGALFRRKGLVLLTFLTVIAGTVIVTLLLPDRYDSRMKILVKNQRVDVAITPEATNAVNAPTIENEASENKIKSETALLTFRNLVTGFLC